MKKRILSLGMAVVMLAFSLVFVGCESSGCDGDHLCVVGPIGSQIESKCGDNRCAVNMVDRSTLTGTVGCNCP